MCFLLVSNALASPLIFKTSKEITGEGLTEIALIDTSKYKQIRIYIESDADKREKLLDGQKFSVVVYAVEDNRELFLVNQYEHYVQFNKVLDCPPQQIKIKVKGATVYRVYVWGN
jgi:hypothetical protein